MPWITVDCDLPDHPKMAALPNDAARYGWIVALARAKRQRKPGTFADAKHFRMVMGSYGKFLPAYLAARLLEEIDGTLQVHDWLRHQWAAAKAGQREDKPETNEGQTEDNNKTPLGLVRASRPVAVAVPVLVDVSSSGEGSGEGPGFDVFHLVETLTNRPFGYSAGSRVMQTLAEDVKALGPDAVSTALRDEHASAKGKPTDAATLVFGAHKRLYPLTNADTKPKAKGLSNLSDLQSVVESA